LQVATIKEYLSGVRYVCRIYGNNNIATENSQFGIGNRVMVDNRDKSLSKELFERVVIELKKSENKDDQRIAAQLQLERYLGLRNEESSKFNGNKAILDDGRVFIQYGTKGGRERIINQVTEKGIEAIKYAKELSESRNAALQTYQSHRDKDLPLWRSGVLRHLIAGWR